MTTFLTNEGYLALAIFAFVQACCIPISSEITSASRACWRTSTTSASPW